MSAVYAPKNGDGDIRRLFAFANLLHENFYENDSLADQVAESREDVEALQDNLRELLT